MLRLKYIITIAALLLFCDAHAQYTKEERQKFIKPFRTIANYRIGELFPDFGASKVTNYSQATIKTADFNDRLLILDFWGLSCVTCIEALPHMDELQKKFGDKIKILPITCDREADVTPFWKTNRHLKNLTLSSIVEDKAITSNFEHNGIPHEVWVYKGKIIGITSHYYVDEYNISQVLSGKIPNWPVRNEFYEFAANKTPLFKANPGQVDPAEKSVNYSKISGYKEINGVAVDGQGFSNKGIVRDTLSKTVRAYTINGSIFNNYTNCWMKVLGYETFNNLKFPGLSAANIVKWEVADKSKYIYEAKPGTYEMDWLRQHGICFESLNKDEGQTDQQVAQSMISDMNRLLGLNVRWEKRKEKVLVLVRTTKEDKLKPKKTLTADISGHIYERITQKGTLYQYRDASLGFLCNELNHKETNPYVFNETGYQGNVDMDLDIPSWTDIAAIKKVIAPYGLDLKEEERLVDKFVFSEVNATVP